MTHILNDKHVVYGLILCYTTMFVCVVPILLKPEKKTFNVILKKTLKNLSSFLQVKKYDL